MQVTTEKELKPYDINLEVLPEVLSCNKLADKLEKSKADPKVANIQFHFGNKDNEKFLGLFERRPVLLPSMVHENEFAFKKLARIAGYLFDFSLSRGSFVIEPFKEYASVVDQLKKIVLKDPNAQPTTKIGITEYFLDCGLFNPLKNEDIAKIVKNSLIMKNDGVAILEYRRLPSGSLGKMTYPEKSVYMMRSMDGECGYALTTENREKLRLSFLSFRC